MSPKGRITKKEAKEDKLVTFTFRMTEFYQKYSNQVLVGVGVLVVVVVVAYLLLNGRAGQTKEAQALLGQANLELRVGDVQQGISTLDMIVRRFPETQSGKRAIFLLGNAYFYSKEFQLSKTTFEKYLLVGKEAYLLASAQAGIAQCCMEMGNLSLAGENFLKAAQESPGDFLKREYMLGAALALSKTEKKDKARQVCQELIKQFPESPQAQQAKIDLAQMGPASS